MPHLALPYDLALPFALASISSRIPISHVYAPTMFLKRTLPILNTLTQQIQIMQRLYSKNLNTPLQHRHITCHQNLIQWQIILNLPLIISIHQNPTPTGIEGRQYTIFSQVNYQLDQLFMDLLDSFSVALWEKLLNRKWNVIVINVDCSVLVVVQKTKVDDVLVVNVL